MADYFYYYTYQPYVSKGGIKMKKSNLFNKDFTLVVIGQIISLFGNSILRFALPLYLLKETGSATIFGIVTACSFLPMIVLSILGGVLADRVNKKNIMVFLDFLTAIVILIFTIALGKLLIIPLFIFILMILYGIQGAYQPSVQASIPFLVKEESIVSANAVINQVNALANLLGPILGGILFSILGLYPILILSIICFTFSAILEIFINIPYEKQITNLSIFKIVKKDLLESLNFIRKEKPILFKVMILLSCFNLFLSSMLIIGLPVIIIEILEISDRLFGYSQGALAAGGLFGGILAGVLGDKLNIKKSYIILLLCSIIVIPMSFALMLNLSSFISYIIITVCSFFMMALATTFSIQIMSFVQIQTPSHIVGKVISCLLALAMCAQPVGQALYGFLFDKFIYYPWVIILAAALISCIISIYSKSIFSSFKK